MAILFRRNTAAGAATDNPILAAGEPGFETDTGVFKIGDGTHTWSTLPAGYVMVRASDLSAYAPLASPTFTAPELSAATFTTLTNSNFNTAGREILVGSLGFQPFSLNNAFICENCYYNSGWKYDQTGYASLFYFNAGEGQFRVFASGTGGASLPGSGNITQLKINADGTVAIGGTGSEVPGIYSSNTLVITSTWMYGGASGVPRSWSIGASDMYWEIGGNGAFHWRNSSDADVTTLDYLGTFSTPVVKASHLVNLASYINSSPANGDLWFDGTDLKFRVGGVTKTVTLT